MRASRERTEHSRREFIRLAGLTAASLATQGCPQTTPPPPLPLCGELELGGAPDSHEGRTIAAFCDVVVPGRACDPTQAPGALEAGAPAMFFDPELPALSFVPLLVLFLDNTAQGMFAGRSFAELTVAERERALNKALADVQLLEFAVLLAKLAYFSSEVAAEHLGYPGANVGYHTHPDFSLGTAVSREKTTDGNLP